LFLLRSDWSWHRFLDSCVYLLLRGDGRWNGFLLRSDRRWNGFLLHGGRCNGFLGCGRSYGSFADGCGCGLFGHGARDGFLGADGLGDHFYKLKSRFTVQRKFGTEWWRFVKGSDLLIIITRKLARHAIMGALMMSGRHNGRGTSGDRRCCVGTSAAARVICTKCGRLERRNLETLVSHYGTSPPSVCRLDSPSMFHLPVRFFVYDLFVL
jgi:hypothetical protein